MFFCYVLLVDLDQEKGGVLLGDLVVLLGRSQPWLLGDTMFRSPRFHLICK